MVEYEERTKEQRMHEVSKELPPIPKRTRGGMTVALLDDTEFEFQVEPKSKGEALMKKVNMHLNLEESEFFGLLFLGHDNFQYWLDPQKPIMKQIKDPKTTKFKFRVMYYTPDPNLLQEYTRYLFTLQVRRDLLDGRLWCSEDTGALLASYIVQGELGDYDPYKHLEGYLKGFNFVPNQTAEIEQKIVDYHRSHSGKSPAVSDHEMLDIARKLDMYGITLHRAKTSDGKEVDLAIHHLGIIIFQDKLKVNSYLWKELRKMSFRKKKFILKFLPKSESGTIRVVSYSLKNRNAAKNFWKICVNNHVFFRSPQRINPVKKSSFKKGSKYRYSGRTKKEITVAASRKQSLVDGGISASPSLDAKYLKVAESPVISVHSKYQSEDEGTYSLQSEASATYRNNQLAEDNFIPTTNILQNQNIITIQHQDTVDSGEISPPVLSHTPVSMTPLSITPSTTPISTELPENENVNNDQFARIPLLDKLKLNNNENSSVRVNEHVDAPVESSMELTVPDFEIADVDELRLSEFKTEDFSLEVESMFKKINSEYGSSPTGWQYTLTNITPSEHEDDKPSEVPSEYTEVDANQARIDLDNKQEEMRQSESIEADGGNILSKKIEELYMPQRIAHIPYDSDSDASVMTVDEEESAFEDDGSLPPSSSSSVSSLHRREGYLQQLRKLKSNSEIYNIAKEILLTERTLVKDLEVLTVSFRNVIEKERVMQGKLVKFLYDNLDPLYDYHCSMLSELEERLALWESGCPPESTQDSIQKIGDIMHRNMRQLKQNIHYIKKHEDILLAIEAEAKHSKDFEKVYKEFELGNICYLSLNSFLLKPAQRLFYYKNMLERLTEDYDELHSDAIDSRVALEEVTDACKQVKECRDSLENLHKLVELERDLIGLEGLLHPKRKFIREGCLHKICRKGPQPRMVFLLSDVLLYTSQGVTATNQFRARAVYPLQGLKVEDGGVELHSLYAFTILAPGGKSFVLAASSPEEKVKWMEDIQNVIKKATKSIFCGDCEANRNEFILYVGRAKNYMCSNCKMEISKLERMSPDDRLLYWQLNHPPVITVKNLASSDVDSDDEGSYELGEKFSSLDRRHAHSRTISTRKVCWHRNASISMVEYTMSIQNSYSGELRRKFKNTHKWQKLWAVFTNFCLYFFKHYEEDSPYASLPLIGYNFSTPPESEIHDDHAFKLQFKTHTYIFKTENEYTFKRWKEVLTIATKNSGKSRLKNRMAARIGSTS